MPRSARLGGRPSCPLGASARKIVFLLNFLTWGLLPCALGASADGAAKAKATSKAKSETKPATSAPPPPEVTPEPAPTSLPEMLPPPPIYGGEPTQRAFKVWLSAWRNLYVDVTDDTVPSLADSQLPTAFRHVVPKVVVSAGGAAGGVVTEGIGYAMMLEGIMAAQGDGFALELGLALTRAWLGMAQGPDAEAPLGGADASDGSATKVDVWPYGVSAVPGLGPAGVATWKYPVDACAANKPWKPCHGSAADGDEDALLGMIYLAAALGYPDDFVDIAIRAIVSFASADLGYPDMYRVLPDGKRVYVPKAGSQWGGLTPPGGKFKTAGPAWCYAPAYFAPGHYRTFRDFARTHWRSSFNAYLPPHLDGTATTLDELVGAFDGAILAGYNILYYSSCPSGTVSNWVGVETPCKDNETLACGGIPWANTPYVGKYQGQCSSSGTKWGAFGADASRMPWRLAMDFILFPAESEQVDIYYRTGWVDKGAKFNARLYLNRIATHYKHYARCDGGIPGDCDCHYPGCEANATQAFKLSAAFEVVNWPRTPGLTCDNVPHHGQAWWAGFMSYPTFTAFIAPYEDPVPYLDKYGNNATFAPMDTEESASWLDTFANICNFSNFTEEGDWEVEGRVCQKTYFHVSQEAISTMIMSGSLTQLPSPGEATTAVMKKVADTGALPNGDQPAPLWRQLFVPCAALFGVTGLVFIAVRGWKKLASSPHLFRTVSVSVEEGPLMAQMQA